MERVLSKIRNLDAYPKINEDFFSRTISGGLITLVSSIFILILFFSELSSYLRTSVDTKLVVDTSRGGRLHINFDVTFPDVPCSLVSLDAMDISGERHFDIRHDILREELILMAKKLKLNKVELVPLRLRSLYRNMEAGLRKMKSTVVHAMVRKWQMMSVVICVKKCVKLIGKEVGALQMQRRLTSVKDKASWRV